MAIQKKIIPLNLFQMPNEKADPQSLAPGTLTTLENARFNKTGRIDKRTGYDALAMLDVDGNTITDCKGLVGDENSMLLWAGDKVYAQNRGQNTWDDKGKYHTCETTIESVDETGGAMVSCDSVSIAGLTYYVYEQAVITASANIAKIWLTIIDETSNEIVRGPTEIVIARASSARVIEFGGLAFLFFNRKDSSAIWAFPLLVATSDYDDDDNIVRVILASDAADGSAAFTAQHWDVYNYQDDRIVIAYHDDSTTTSLKIRYFDSTLTELTGAYAVRTVTGMSDDPHFLRIIESSSADRFMVVDVTAAEASAKYCVINEDGTENTGATALNITSASTESTVLSMSGFGAVSDASTPLAGVWLRIGAKSSTFTNDTITHQLHIADNGTIDLGVGPIFDLQAISKKFTYNGTDWWVFYREIDNDSSYFVATMSTDVSGNIRLYPIAQFLWGRAPDTTSISQVKQVDANVTEISTGIFRVAVLSKDSSAEVGGVVSVKIDFTSSELFTAVPYSRSMLIAGTNLCTFDGQHCRELGFFHRPKPCIASQTTGGSIADGAYKIVWVYEYTDRNGLLHRSAPSDPTSITVAGGSGTAQIRCTVPCYLITRFIERGSYRGIVKMIPYRTDAGGTIYYRENYFNQYATGTEGPGDHDNSSTSESNIVDLAYSDADLQVQPILYTDSGEVTPNPIPPCKYLAVWNSRIFAAGSSRDESVYYSKLNQVNLAPEMTEAFSIGIQDKPGRTSTIVGYSDKIILSKRGRMFYAYGDGPDNLGQGGSFSLFEQIIGVSGAVNGKSVAVNKEGLYFKSDKGMYILGQGLDTQYIGAPYEDKADTTIIKTISPIDTESLRMLTSAGIIEHDTFFNSWSFNTGLTPLDAAIYNNQFYLLADDDVVYKENRSVYKDNAASYAMSMVTGWLSFAGLVGYHRFLRLFLKATYKSVHTLKISLAYDYSDSYTDKVVITPSPDTATYFQNYIFPTGTSSIDYTRYIDSATGAGGEYIIIIVLLLADAAAFEAELNTGTGFSVVDSNGVEYLFQPASGSLTFSDDEPDGVIKRYFIDISTASAAIGRLFKNGVEYFYDDWNEEWIESFGSFDLGDAEEFGYKNPNGIGNGSLVDDYRFTVFPTVQKCEAFRIKIEEVIIDATGGNHQSLEINFVGIQIGTKRGLPKIKAAQKVGVTNI